MSENCENVHGNKYHENIQKMRLFDDEFLRAVVEGNAHTWAMGRYIA